MSAGVAPLTDRQTDIDRIFGAETVVELLQRAEALRDDEKMHPNRRSFAAAIFSALSRNAPLSIACAFASIRRARAFARIEEALALEYRFAWRCLEHSDLYEGIRAAIISRDVPPAWKPPTLAEVPATLVDAMLRPLGSDELEFGSA